MRKYTLRDWVTIGLFGALWGVVEAVLGSYLHEIFPSTVSVFPTGLVVGSMGVIVALTVRHFVPRRGAILMVSVVAAILKLLGLGKNKIGPVTAILIEGCLMELALWPARTPARWAFVLAGALGVGWSLPHRFIMQRLLRGQAIVEVYTRIVQEGSRLLGLETSVAWVVLAVYLLVHVILGGVGGWSAWTLGGAVSRRMGHRGPTAGASGS